MVGVHDGRKAVGDHDDGASPCQRIESYLYLCLIVRIGKGGGLVQNQHRRIFQHGTGDGQPLCLTAGEVNAL